jgi:hypothetical protein
VRPHAGARERAAHARSQQPTHPHVQAPLQRREGAPQRRRLLLQRGAQERQRGVVRVAQRVRSARVLEAQLAARARAQRGRRQRGARGGQQQRRQRSAGVLNVCRSAAQTPGCAGVRPAAARVALAQRRHRHRRELAHRGALQRQQQRQRAALHLSAHEQRLHGATRARRQAQARQASRARAVRPMRRPEDGALLWCRQLLCRNRHCFKIPFL